MISAPVVRRHMQALVLVCLSALILLGAPSAVVAQPSPAEPAAASGLEDFGACLAGGAKGSLVILLDQSGSLRQTDPDKARVTAGHYLVDRLISVVDTSGVSLDVHVAGFAADYAAAGEWTGMSASTAETVKASITAVGDDIKDYDTDYWNALEGARQDLVGHDTSGCRAIAWFSDGAYDLDVRPDAAAQDQFGTEKTYAPGVALTDEAGVAYVEQWGKDDICRPTGVADQLRALDITVLGIGLSDGATDFTFMQRVVGGGGQNAAANGVEQCGDLSSPAGSFYPVSDIDSLLLAFDSISAAGAGIDSQTISICQGTVCTMGQSVFVLDRSLEQVHIFASSQVEGLDAYLYGPGSAEPIVLSSETSRDQEQGGVRYNWLTPRSLEADINAGDVPVWDGVWRLAFVDKTSASSDKTVRVNLHLSSPTMLAWQDLSKTPLRVGETVEDVSLAILDGPDGDPVDASTITGAVSMTVTLTDSSGKEVELFSSTNLADLAKPQQFDLPEDLSPGKATVARTLTITTAQAVAADGTAYEGTTLSPTIATDTVTVDPPLDFPTLAGSVDFGRLEEDLSVEGSLPVNGPGCIWLADTGATLTGAPAEAGEITVDSTATGESTCVEVAEGGTASLPLTLTTSGQANGAVTGTIGVVVAPLDEPDRAETIEVPFSAEMRRPLDVGTTSIAFVLALVLGVGIPVALLYVFKFLSACIPPGQLLVATKVIRVPEDNTAAQIGFASEELNWKFLSKRTRELTIGPYRLQARAGAAPASVPVVELVEPDVPSVSGAPVGHRKRRAVIPLGVRGNWIAVLDQPDSPRHVTLIVLATANDESAIAKVKTDAAEKIAGRVRSVAPQQEADSAEPSHDDGAGLGAPPGGSDTWGTPPGEVGFGASPGAQDTWGVVPPSLPGSDGAQQVPGSASASSTAGDREDDLPLLPGI